MYLSFYGFTEIPFSVTPNPRFIFYSKTHKEAFALLLYGINNRFGFIELTGEVGTGKTTVLRTLLSQLSEERYRTALIFNPSLSAVDLMRAINHEFGLPSDSDNSAELTGALNRFLLQEKSAGRTVVLIIDEAQNLAPHVLEQVRLISNLETDTEKLIQIILAGQPELGLLLERPELRQINQRIALRYRLQPLDREDCAAYIHHRLLLAGGKGSVTFTPGALTCLYRYSRGTPRLINILADRALLIGYTEDRREITARTATLAYRDVMLKPAERFFPRFRRGIALSLLIIVLVTIGYVGFPSRTATTGGKSPAVPAVVQKDHPVVSSPPSSPSAPAAGSLPPETVQAVYKELSLRSEARSATRAYNAIAALWKAPLVRKIDERSPLLKELKRQAGKGGLEMTHITGDMDELLRTDIPLLLSISPREPKGNYLIALTGTKDGNYIVDPPLVGRSDFSRGELASIWTGQAYILWRNDAGIRFPMTAGSRGEDVKKLQDLLLTAGFRTLTPNGTYDRQTVQTVKEFQASRRIKETGVAGPLTLIQLYRAAGGQSVPTLAQQGKGGGA